MTPALAHIGRSTVLAGGRRSLMVAVLIAMAVAVGVGVNVIGRSDAASPSLEHHRSVFPTSDLTSAPSGAALDYFGAADVRVDWWGPPRDVPWLYGVDASSVVSRTAVKARAARRTQTRDAEHVQRVIERAIPSGTSTLMFAEGIVPGHEVVASTADLTNPLVSGMFEPLDGPRAVQNDDVLMSEPALEEFGAQVGDSIVVNGIGRVEIVGRVRDAGDWTRAVMVTAAAPSATELRGQRRSWLIGGLPPDRRDDVAARIRAGLDAYARKFGDTDAVTAELIDAGKITSGFVHAAVDAPRSRGQLFGRSPVPGAFGTAALLIVVAVITVSAFTVDHRRRVRHAGVLAAVGATPSQVAGLASVEALLIGTAGAVAGAIVGVVGGIVAQPLAERMLERSIDGVTLHAFDVAVPALLGPVAAVLAARRPARAAARVPVVQALRGHPSAGERSWFLPVGGLAALILGVPAVAWLGGPFSMPTVVVAIAVAVIVSAARVLIGRLTLTPRLTGRLPLLPRLVARDLVRQQARLGILIGALTALVAVAVLQFAVAHTANAHLRARSGPATRLLVSTDVDQEPPGPHDVALATRAAPVREVVHIPLMRPVRRNIRPPEHDAPAGPSATMPSQSLVRATPEVLRGLGLDPSLAERPHGLVLEGALDRDNRPVPADIAAIDLRLRGTNVRLPARAISVPGWNPVLDERALPAVMLPPALADDLNLAPTDGPMLVVLQRPLRASEAEAVEASAAPGTIQIIGAPVIDVTERFRGIASTVGIGLILALLIVGPTSALGAVESDPGIRLAVAIGAHPRMRRRFLALQAGLQVILAAALGIPTGLVAAMLIVRQLGVSSFGVVVPWMEIGVLALVPPVAIGGIVALVSRSRPVQPPVRRIA